MCPTYVATGRGATLRALSSGMAHVSRQTFVRPVQEAVGLGVSRLRSVGTEGEEGDYVQPREMPDCLARRSM